MLPSWRSKCGSAVRVWGRRLCASEAAEHQAGGSMADANAQSAEEGRKKQKKQKKRGTAARGTAAQVTIDMKTPIREFRFPRLANAKCTGLRTQRSLITVNRGPHIDKKSREQFDIQTRKWRIVMDTEVGKLREKLQFLKQHRVLGVEISARFSYMTRLEWPLQPAPLSDADKWKLFEQQQEQPEVYTPAKLASDFNIEVQQVYHLLRIMEERVKHRELFGSNASSSSSSSSS